MSIAVSQSVFGEVQDKIAAHNNNISLLQAQISVEQESAQQWAAILTELVPPAQG